MCVNRHFDFGEQQFQKAQFLFVIDIASQNISCVKRAGSICCLLKQQTKYLSLGYLTSIWSFMVCGNKNTLALVWMPFGLSGDVSEFPLVGEVHKFFPHFFEELYHLAYRWQTIS